MHVRRLTCLALLGLAALPALARAGDDKQGDAPTLVFRVRSIDAVLDNAKFLATLGGKEDFGQQLEGLIKAKVGPKGLEGIDTRRPFGAYLRVGEDLNDSAGVIMIPIADERAFLGLLENLNAKAEKGNDGLYNLQIDAVPVPVAFRFANKYAYVTAQNLGGIDKDKLLEPARVFPRNLTADVSGAIRLDQIPKTARDLALAAIEEQVAKTKDEAPPNETETQRKVRIASIEATGKQLAELLRNGREITGQVILDRQKKSLGFEMTMDARPGSALGKDIKALGESKSLFGGLLVKGAAVNQVISVAVPKELRKALEPGIEELIAQATAKETDAEKRKQVERVLRALEPSLKAGELDAGFSMRAADNGKYTAVGGLKLKDADEVEAVVRDLLKGLQPRDRDKIKLDVANVGRVKIHRIETGDAKDKEFRAAFGDNPVFVAFRGDAVLFALGEDGLAAIKEAVVATPQVTPPMLIEIAVGRLAAVAAKTDAQKQAARQAFGKGEPGMVRITLEGGPVLRLRFTTDLSVLQYTAAIAQGTAARPPNDNE
jgi:hypothetical protein